MAIDGMKRVLDQHAALLKEWRRQLSELESGATKGPSNSAWHDDTGDNIAVLKRDVANDRGD